MGNVGDGSATCWITKDDPLSSLAYSSVFAELTNVTNRDKLVGTSSARFQVKSCVFWLIGF